MAYFDVFNGDADGLCSLQQLRLAEPLESELVTGVKRDIALLKKVSAGKDDTVTVLDISLDKNRADLERLLDRGSRIYYFDHHFAGRIPDHQNLTAFIDPTPDQGTSLLADRYVGGRFRLWAIVGTFGDNFDYSARKAGEHLNLSEEEFNRLKELGILLNYNAYGATLDDLYFHPGELFSLMQPFENPLIFVEQADTFQILREGYQNDMSRAEELSPLILTEKYGVYVLPLAPWARRVSGVYANL
ncbi:MAG TPA: acetyltransferase, partial [Thermodesulfobacteriaceae bacterium]|nr:acetyltransferase [Thermodesulfobacteriaceae bacterium]